MSDLCRIYIVSTAIVMCAVLISTTEAQTANKLSDALQRNDDSALLVGDFRGDTYRDLERLREKEEAIAKLIQGLGVQMNDIKTQKRAHVQCLVNLVACYRKRK